MRTRHMLIGMTALWVTAAVWAQQGNPERPPQPPQGQQPGGRGGPGMPGGAPGGRGGMMMGGAFWQLRQFDVNGDLQIDEKELNTGLDKMKTRADEAHAVLLKVFDANGDKKISGDEEQKVREFIDSMMSLRQYDRNRDWQVDEEELRQAFDQLADASQRLNDGIMERYDKDRDGKLSPEETNAAKAEMQAPWQPGPRREGGPRPAGDRGPGQPPAGQPPPAGQQPK